MTLEFISHSGATAGQPNAHEIVCQAGRLLLDCGASHRGARFFDTMSRPDLLWISHAHGDHCGGIFELLERWPGVTLAATEKTAELLPFALGAGRSHKKRRARVDAMIGKIHRLRPGRWVGCPGLEGVRMMALPAGHVAGAAMIVVEIPDGDRRRRVLYTGDFCTHDQIVVQGGGIPKLGDGMAIDAVISEAMLGTDKKADRLVWEDEAQRLVETVGGAEGPVLIGVAGIGEGLEVAALLAAAGTGLMVDEYLRQVFEASGLERREVTFGDRGRMAGRLRADGVVLAPGDQYQRGSAAAFLAGSMIDDRRASLFVLNRARRRTGAGRLLASSSGDEIDWFGHRVERNAEVHHFRLINHAPRWQLEGFITGVGAAKTLLVHGSDGGRWALKRSIEKRGFQKAVEVVERGKSYPL